MPGDLDPEQPGDPAVQPHFRGYPSRPTSAPTLTAAPPDGMRGPVRDVIPDTGLSIASAERGPVPKPARHRRNRRRYGCDGDSRRPYGRCSATDSWRGGHRPHASGCHVDGAPATDSRSDGNAATRPWTDDSPGP